MEKIGNKFILGITGGVGSGKSRILDILQKDYGFHVIQADQVARQLMEPGMESYHAVVDYLGPAVVKEDKSLDRAVMADIIFHDPIKRKRVDELTHPLVWKAAMKEAMEAREGRVVIEAAIPSKDFRQMCCISAAICFFVSSRLLLLSMTESQKDRNTSSLTWLSMMLRVFSLVYPRFALSRSKRFSLDV